MEPYTKISTEPFFAANYYGGDPEPTGKVSGFLESRVDGFKNPHHISQIANHVQAGTVCEGVLRQLSLGSYAGVRKRFQNADPSNSSLASFYGNLYQGFDVPEAPSFPSGLDNRALVSLFNDAYQKINQSQGLVFLGELRETVHSLKHPFKALTDLLRLRRSRLGKLRPRRSRDFLKAAADSWLEIQFGIKPLVADIVSLVTYLQDRKNQIGVEYFPIRGYSQFRSAFSGPGFRVHVHSLSYTGYVMNKLLHSARYKGEIRIDPLNEGWDNRDFARLGFGLNNFIPTLYELTPFSFLLDYFTDVGDLINSFSVPIQDIPWVTHTRRSELTESRQILGDAKPYDDGNFTYIPVSLTSVPTTTRYKWFSRDPILAGHLPRPTISVELPNGYQFANTIALIASSIL